MFDQLTLLFTSTAWSGYVARILLFFLLAWLVQRLSRRLAARLLHLSRFTARGRKLRAERRQTLRSLLASIIAFFAYLTAVLFSLGQFVDVTTVIWLIGLFSAGFGFAARPVLSDVLTGVSLLFEDTFAVGEKVEILGVEGVVEMVNLRTTWLRAPTGEVYTVPNGEIRVVRNFSRGRFSMTAVKLKVAAASLGQALPLLEALGQEAVVVLPNLLEPWQVISESGAVGEHAELTLLAKARFGKAADMRPRLLALLQERLTEAAIPLFD